MRFEVAEDHFVVVGGNLPKGGDRGFWARSTDRETLLWWENDEWKSVAEEKGRARSTKKHQQIHADNPKMKTKN